MLETSIGSTTFVRNETAPVATRPISSFGVTDAARTVYFRCRRIRAARLVHALVFDKLVVRVGILSRVNTNDRFSLGRSNRAACGACTRSSRSRFPRVRVNRGFYSQKCEQHDLYVSKFHFGTEKFHM